MGCGHLLSSSKVIEHNCYMAYHKFHAVTSESRDKSMFPTQVKLWSELVFKSTSSLLTLQYTSSQIFLYRL